MTNRSRYSFKKLAILLLILCLITVLPLVQAAPARSIPVNGRYSTLAIGVRIQQEPRWAHDVVLDAMLVWNQAQEWYAYDRNLHDGPIYQLFESSIGNVTVCFRVPTSYSGFAMGWTEYKFASFSKTSIISAQVFLGEKIFSGAQENNSTARQYAFRLALHELGRVLGLGSIIDGRDIMDPRDPSHLTTQQSLISTLDLYALHTLASGGNVPAFIHLPGSVTYRLIDAREFLPGESRSISRP